MRPSVRPRHGTLHPQVSADRSANAEVVIRSELRGDRLWLEVVDNGPGDSGGGLARGIGLNNVVARLQEQYGADYEFAAAARHGGRFGTRIGVPARRAAT
jgi:two-component system, LytTR family, sensor kinase